MPDHISFPSHLSPLVLVLGVATLALGMWISSLWMSPVVKGSDLATATPTKTPPPVDVAQGTPAAFDNAAALLPTLTPVPTALPVPSPTPVPVSTPTEFITPQPWVVELAQKRGINPMGRYIIIDQDSQQMHIVEDGHLVRLLDITTGDPALGWDTPAWFGVIGKYWGTFQGLGGVMADEGWWLFKRGGNFLIHGLPYVLDDQGQKVYKGADELGFTPASRGCIRLAPDNARWFTAWKPQGVPIIILPYTDPSEVPG